MASATTALVAQAREALALAANALNAALFSSSGLDGDDVGLLGSDVQLLVDALILSQNISATTAAPLGNISRPLPRLAEYLDAGAVVQCTGLSKANMNGCFALVASDDDSGGVWTGDRYRVQAWPAGAGKTQPLRVSVRPQNLRPARVESLPDASIAAAPHSTASAEPAPAPAPAAVSPPAAAAPPAPLSPPAAATSHLLGTDVVVEARNGRGRCAVAATALRAGALLSGCSGAPYAVCLSPSQHAHCCEGCLRALGDATTGVSSVRCDGSAGGCPARFCSPSCRESSRPFHQNSCGRLHRASPLSALIPAGGGGSAAAGGGSDRLELLMLAARCLWRRRDSSVRAAARAGDCDDDDDDILFDGLELGPTTPADSADAAMAAQLSGFLPAGASAADILHTLGVLRRNCFRVADESGALIGAGCYPRASMFNHSCNPNCVVTYLQGGRMQVRAACDVPAGCELAHCYTDLCAPTAERRRKLERQYGFHCECRRCAGGVPGCEDLDALINAPADGTDAERERTVAMSTTALARAAATSDPNEAMRLAEVAVHARRQHCHPLSLRCYRAERTLCSLALTRGAAGDDATARECGRRSLAFLESALAHVPWHPSLSVERMQQACSEAVLGERQAAVRLMGLCVGSLEVTHGVEHVLTERARVVREAVERTPDIVQAGKMLRPWTTAVSRVTGDA